MAQTPSDNVWIGDLPADITQDQLLAVFTAYGNITSARVNSQSQPGKKLSALVRFASVDEATWVVQNINGNMPEGLLEPIVCKFASTGSRDKGGGKSGGKGQPPPPPGMPPSMQGFHANSLAHQAAQPEAAKANIWIGDLPPAFTQEECQAIFSAYGTIVQCRVTPPQPGRNASALVRFSMPHEAAWLVENLNGNLPEGLDTPIVVKFAKEPRNAQAAPTPPAQAAPIWGPDPRSQPYSGGAGMKGGGKVGKSGKGCGDSAPLGTFQSLYGAVKGAGVLGGGQHVPTECQLHVRNLPPDTTDMDLMRLFSPFGALAPMKSLAMFGPDGTCKGVGFIDFVDAVSAQAAALALDNFALPDGTLLGVTQKKPSKKGGKGEGGKGGGKGGGWGGSWTGFAEGPMFA